MEPDDIIPICFTLCIIVSLIFWIIDVKLFEKPKALNYSIYHELEEMISEKMESMDDTLQKIEQNLKRSEELVILIIKNIEELEKDIKKKKQ